MATSPQPSPGPALRALVALPALDEEKTVAAAIRGIPRRIPGVASVDVLVVDDGSSDRTGEEARAAGARVIRHETPRGVGAAFATALRSAVEDGADLLITIDADGQFDPGDIPAVLAPVLAGEADFTSASRFADPAQAPDMPRVKRWGNRVLARLVSQLTGQRFHDVSCGMRCYGRSALLALNPLGRFTYTQEVFLNLAFKQLRIVEVPVSVRGEREHGTSRVASSLWRYGLHTSGILFRCYRDYHPLRFFGAMAVALAVPALGLLLFLLAHYAQTGTFSPHKWAGFSGAALMALAVLLFFMGLVGDMLARHRIYLEELLAHQRAELPRSRR
jgi:glycosyltransferase involved in cell wall biosynthesis